MPTTSPVRWAPASEGITLVQRLPPSTVWYKAPPEPPAQTSAAFDDTEIARKIVREVGAGSDCADFMLAGALGLGVDFAADSVSDFVSYLALDLVSVWASGWTSMAALLASTVTEVFIPVGPRLALKESFTATSTSSQVLPPSRERCSAPVALMVQRGARPFILMRVGWVCRRGAGTMAADACGDAGFALLNA